MREFYFGSHQEIYNRACLQLFTVVRWLKFQAFKCHCFRNVLQVAPPPRYEDSFPRPAELFLEEKGCSIE